MGKDSLEEHREALIGGRSIDIRIAAPLPLVGDSSVLSDVLEALRRTYPTQRFSIEFAPKGPLGKRFVNIIVPFRGDE